MAQVNNKAEGGRREMTSSGDALSAGDVAAVWDLKLPDGNHRVVFEHGTTSGKRVITVDDNEVFRKNWMFRLVGSESFKIGKRSALISISSNSLTFEYVLTIDGKSLKKFVAAQAKNTRVWLPEINGCGHRIVLDMETMDVYVDGSKAETVGEFTDDGCETHFSINDSAVYIRASRTGEKGTKGLLHHLVIADVQLPPVKETM